jgi:GxxExxY protein
VGLIGHCTNPISERVIGAAIDVHRHLGPGLLESSYHACLRRELDLRAIAYDSKVVLPLECKGVELARGYVIDFLIEGSLVVKSSPSGSCFQFTQPN